MSDPPRLLILADPTSFLSAILTEAAFRVARAQDVEVIGVCDVARRPPRRGRAMARELCASAVKRAFDADQSIHVRSLVFRDVRAIARRFGAPVVVPPDRDVNAPAFVKTVADDLRPDWALSLVGGQIFGRDLLAALRRPVNYHNGLLPAYRGIGATAWSMFHDEPVTGFTYHRMNAGIDDGPILLQGALPVSPDATMIAMEWDKGVAAAAQMEAVFAALRRGDPGRPQTGTPSYFSAAAWRRIRQIDDPSAHTWDDLVRRLRCFLHLTMQLGSARHQVTKLRIVAAGRRPGPFAFRTSDGVVAEPVRFLHLPLWLYRLYRPWWPGRP